MESNSGGHITSVVKLKKYVHPPVYLSQQEDPDHHPHPHRSCRAEKDALMFQIHDMKNKSNCDADAKDRFHRVNHKRKKKAPI